TSGPEREFPARNLKLPLPGMTSAASTLIIPTMRLSWGPRERWKVVAGVSFGAVLLGTLLAPSLSGLAAGDRSSDDRPVGFAGSAPRPARAERARGPADPDAPMDRMLLPLRRRSSGDRELEALLARQQDPASPDYHRWLTPEEFGQRFGLADEDIQEVVDWLTGQGFRIDSIGSGPGWIQVSG